MDLLHSPDTVGLLAGALTTIAFLPQLIKTWRSRSAEDVSIGMFVLFGAGVVLWGIYGWEIHALPVILTNVVTFILAAAILALKLIYDRRSRLDTPKTIAEPVNLNSSQTEAPVESVNSESIDLQTLKSSVADVRS